MHACAMDDRTNVGLIHAARDEIGLARKRLREVVNSARMEAFCHGVVSAKKKISSASCLRSRCMS